MSPTAPEPALPRLFAVRSRRAQVQAQAQVGCSSLYNAAAAIHSTCEAVPLRVGAPTSLDRAPLAPQEHGTRARLQLPVLLLLPMALGLALQLDRGTMAPLLALHVEPLPSLLLLLLLRLLRMPVDRLRWLILSLILSLILNLSLSLSMLRRASKLPLVGQLTCPS